MHPISLIILLCVLNGPSLQAQNPLCNTTARNNILCTASPLDNDDFINLLLSAPINTTSIEVRPASARNAFHISEDLRRFPLLKTLVLVRGSMQSLGERVFPTGSVLETLDVSDNYISHLTQRTFSETENLRFLDLSRNRLGKTGVPSGAFGRLAQLESLNMADNNIISLSHSVFAGLSNLSDLNLSGNSISDSLESRLFSHSPLLRRLSLDRTGIRSLPRDLFRYLPRLEAISLAGNQLKAIPHATLLPLATRIRSVDLSNNQIRSIPSHHFEDWAIEKLAIANNKLEKGIDNFAFDRSALVDVNLGGNGLGYEDLEALRPIAKNLMRLSLAENPLQFVNFDFFSILERLESFNLAATGIEKLPTRHFPFHATLRYLNISHNRLFAFKADYFTTMSRLETLDISQNHIKNFDNLAFGAQLSTLRLAGNPWHCSCRTFAFQELLATLNNSRIGDIQQAACASPREVVGKSIIDLPHGTVPTCSAILGAIGLTDRSELGVLVTVGGAALLILALVAAVVGACLVQRRKRPGSAMNMSRGSSELQGGSNDDIVLQGVSPLAETEKSPVAEHKAFILEVEL